MSDDDKDRLTDVHRRSIRILARSTKATGPANARIAERLEKAAGSGNRMDYLKAEESFDSLPARERRRIGTHAERQAETEKQLLAARRHQPAKPEKPATPAHDDSLDWKPLILDHSPATDPAGGGADWKPGRPVEPRAAKQAASVPKPSVPRPAATRAAGGGPVPARPVLAVEPDTEQTAATADDEKGWDWQRIPDDPILKARRRKPTLDPIEELRRQMLGDDPKRR